jgi:hypothetical protein
MKRILVGLVGCCLVAGILNAQPPDTLWTYTYASSITDEAYAIAPTSDGGFVVGGMGRAPDSTNGALLIRLDNDGHELWVRRFPQFSYEIRSVITMEDGGFAMTGECPMFDISVVRTDSAGVVQWSRCIPTSLYGAQGWSIAKTADGGVAVLGVHSVVAYPTIFLVRLAANGDSLWTQTFASPASYKEGAVLTTSDGGFLVGTSFFEQANVIKTDSAGTVQWTTTFGLSTLEESIKGIDVAINGDYLVAGTQLRPQGWFTYNPYAARLTPSGDTLWTRVYPDLGPAWFYSVHELPNGNILFGGSVGSSFLLVECDPDGNIVWTALYGTPQIEHGYAMCLVADDGVAMAGYRRTIASNSEDIWVVRAGPVLEASENPLVPPLGFQLLSNYPNPFNGSTFISFLIDRPGLVNLSIYNINGRLVDQIHQTAQSIGYHQVTLNNTYLPSGCYFYTVQHSDRTLTGKMILLK